MRLINDVDCGTSVQVIAINSHLPRAAFGHAALLAGHVLTRVTSLLADRTTTALPGQGSACPLPYLEMQSVIFSTAADTWAEESFRVVDGSGQLLVAVPLAFAKSGRCNSAQYALSAVYDCWEEEEGPF